MHIRFPTAVALLLLAISAAWADGPVPPPPPLSAADCSAGQAVTGYPSPGSPIGAGGHCGIPVASGTINVSTIGQIGAYTGTGTITGFTPGGDVTFTSPNFTITKINGAALGSATATSGNVLIGSGTQWVTHAISGDAALAASGALTINAGAITSGKLATGASSGNLGYTPLSPANNLSDLNNATAARTNLGLGSIATHATTEYFAIANSLGEGNANIPAIRTNLGLGSAATQNTGTSGGTIGLNNANNTLSGALTFSGSISGTALTTYLASPAPVGVTTPAAGKFTTLQATGSLTTNITGLVQCLRVDTIGLVTGTGLDCGTGSGGGSGNMTGSGSTTAGNLLVSNNTGGTLTTASDAGLAPGAIARVSGSTLTSTTLSSPTINGAALSGTFSGAPTYSGVPIYSGLSAGTVVAGKYLGLDSGNNLVLSSDVDTISGAQTVSGAKTFSSTLNVTGTFQIGGVTVALPVTVTNGGTGLATQTANAIYKGNGTSPPAVSALSDNGTIVSTTESIDLVANAALFEVANAGSTGTTVNHLAKLTGAPSTAVITAISDVDGALGIVKGGSGTTGSAQIAVTGIALCAFDGATTAGNYVTISSSVAGDCHDGGASRPTAAQVVGRVLATLGSAGNANVALADGFANSSGSGGVSGLTTGQLGIAGSATTITSSVPFGTTGNNTVVETNGSGLIANSLISALPNANLANSTVSFAGHSVALGGANQAIAIGDLSNIANSTIVGNNSGGSGPPLALTTGQVSTLMGLGTMSTQAASAVSISGGTITGATVTGLATPSGTTDAATKAYVDASLTGSNLHPQVAVATAAVLPNSPTAGGSGVGKTLTSGANAVFVTDGYTPVLNDRVLVKDQVAGADNGIYKLTQLGVNGTTPWILTRATDFDQAVTGEVALGAYVFVVNGISTNANSQWQLGAPTPSSITIETTALTFNKLSASQIYTADGTTIQLSSNQFSALPNGILSAITATPNSLLARGASTWAGVAPVNNAVLVTSGAGVPSESTTLPAGLTIPGYLTANQTITLSGDTTGSGTTAITTTTGKVNGVTYPAAPSTNTVPVVTNANVITYQQVPTAAHADSSVTYAKIQNVTTARLLGNNTGSAAAPVEIPFGQTGNSTVIATDSGGHISNTLITALPNSSLATASVTIGSTNVALGATAATVAGLTLTAPTISTITNTGTLTLPTATGTVLETAGTNTVTGTLNVSGTFQIGGATVALPITVANGGTGLTTQTANAIYKGNGTSAPAVSALSDNGTILSSTESLSLTTKAVVTEVANAGTTGTTVNKLAKVTGAPSTAVIAGTGDTTGTVVGIVVGGAGTTGSAQIAFGGQASCIFDGATTAGDFVQVSTTVAGDCHDFGATYPSSGAVLGQVLSTNGAGGTFLMRVIPGGTVAGGGGSGTATTLSVPGSIFTATGTGTATIGFTVAGTSGGIPYFSSASAIGSSAALTLNLPMIGGGAGAAPTVGTRSGNTTEFATSTGAKTSTHGAAWDASGNLIDSGAVPLAMPSIATTHVLGNATGSTAAAADTPVVSGSVGLTVASSGGNLTFNLAAPTNDQSGGGYTIVTGDNGRTVMCGGGFSYPIAQAGTTGFGAGWGTQVHNTSASGNCTITASTSVFKGASNTTTLLLGPGDWTSLSSTGADYDALVGHYSGGGAVVSIGSATAINSAALTFTGLSATYIEYELSCVDLIPAVTSSTALVRVGEGAGPTWMTSGYFSSLYGGHYGSGWTPIGASLNGSGILISQATDVVKDTTRPLTFSLRLANPSSILRSKKVTFESDYNSLNLDGVSLSGSGGFYGDTNADTAIEFLFLEGNIQAGKCTLRGKL